MPENLLIWTTTPWTLSSNVGAAVNPTLTYLKIKHKDEIYYLAKGAFTAQRLEEQFKRKEWLEGVPKLKTLEQIFKEKGGYEIVAELPGSALVGWQYDGPFDELHAQHHLSGYPLEIAAVVKRLKWGPERAAHDVHRVVAWDMVGETEGTGIVHIAPGCGKEDFSLGKEQGLVPVAPLDDSGVFLEGFGELTGKSANDPATTDFVLDNLTKKNRLFAVEKYPHSYPHCWRCKTELLFRLVDEWFIDMRWRDEIMKATEAVTFLPESINGKAREMDWLKNMGDWMISKKRYWGLALPIWVDDKTDDFEVIGSFEELKSRTVEGWDTFAGHSPHRPWIDMIKIKNPKTGNLMSRIPGVGNPWLDAGIVPFSTMKYNSDREYWTKWFPADFITEAFPGQFRNWFYAILAMSTMLAQQAPMKVLLGHGMVRDQWGEEMHKTAGNSIAFDAAADGAEVKGFDKPAYIIKHVLKTGDHEIGHGAYKTWIEEGLSEGKKSRDFYAICPPMSADLMRWMYCRQNPASNINFGPESADDVRSKFIMKLWNTYSFFCNYARLDAFDPAAPQVPVKDRPDIDRWILSDLQLLIQAAHEAFTSYNVMAFCLKAEEFVDDKLSNWYVRRNRRRFWKSDKGADKLAAYQTLYTVLVTLVKLCAPVIPFMTEKMYRNLVPNADSVHLCEYPSADMTLVDPPLSREVDALLHIVSLGGAARNSAKIKVRQPLAELRLWSDDQGFKNAAERFPDQICDELNIKSVRIVDNEPFFTVEAQIVLAAVKHTFGSKAGAVIAALQKLPREKKGELANLNSSYELALGSGESVTIVPIEYFKLTVRGVPGWEVSVYLDTYVGINTQVSESLKLEGLAREVVRHVQNARKDAGLEMDDRIALCLATDDAKLADAIKTHRDYIASETLATQWATSLLGDGAYRVEVKIESAKLVIELKKAT